MPERRRRKLVDRFQYKLITRMVLYWAVYQFTLWNFLFCWRLMEAGKGNFFQQYGQFSREFSPMLICFLVLVPAFVWDAVKFYHRIAGPLVQFKRATKDVTAGRPMRYVRLRENDELMELEDDFNEMLDALAQCGAVTLIGPTKAGNANEPGAERKVDSPDTLTEEVSHVSD